MARMSNKVWLAALLALALLAAPVLAKHHGEDGDDDGGDDGGDDDGGGGDDDAGGGGKLDKKAGTTTDSLGGKWPITKGVLGCIEYDSDEGVCTECLDPYFELNEDGVCSELFSFLFLCLFFCLFLRRRRDRRRPGLNFPSRRRRRFLRLVLGCPRSPAPSLSVSLTHSRPCVPREPACVVAVGSAGLALLHAGERERKKTHKK